MGAGAGGNFGNTLGSRLSSHLDFLSDALTAASAIPGVDTFADLAAIPVDLARGDYFSATLDLLGAVPFVGEIADTAKLARMADDAVDAAKTIKKSKNISNPITNSVRRGKANKLDAHHAFSDIVDNYAGKAKTFSLKGGDGKERQLYQIKGSLRGKKGIFEWILDEDMGVTHRRFIPNGKITGKPNSK